MKVSAKVLGDELNEMKIPEDLNLNEVKGFFTAKNFNENILPGLFDIAKTLLLVLIVFYIGKKLIKWILKLVNRAFERSNTDLGVVSFLNAVIRVGLNVVLFIILISILGFETTSLVALIGSAGLTVGLALQGSLSNFAGGVLILMLKPFRVGDYIISGVNEGTVIGIDIFYTKLLTSDNRTIVVPNGALSNSSITNVTNEPVRRLDLTILVAYSADIKKVKEILTVLAMKQELVLHDRDISVFINSLDPASISMGLRVWVERENYWSLKCILLEQIKESFEKNQIAKA